MLAAAAVNDPTLGSPGLAGFLATFALAVATWLLMRSMVGRLRKVRYGPGPVPPGGDQPAEDVTPDGADTPSAATVPPPRRTGADTDDHTR
jgi:hypothetical protein